MFWITVFGINIIHSNGSVSVSYSVATGVLSRGEKWHGMVLINHLHIVPVFKDEWIYTSTPPLALRSWTRTAVPLTFFMANVEGVIFQSLSDLFISNLVSGGLHCESHSCFPGVVEG